MRSVIEMARSNNGVITASDAERAGVPRSRLSEMARSGELERVEYGIYSLPETWEDEYLIAQLRFPKGVFSDGSALYLHDFTDRMPEVPTMTFPRRYNATSARRACIEVRTCADEVMGLGVETVRTPFGNEVRTYDLERTLCDLLRGRAHPDLQVVNPAMRAYARRKGSDINKLMGYARALGVEKKVRGYMEVLL